MIVAPRTRARLLAAALVTLLLPALSLAQEPVLPQGPAQDEATVRAWKTGFAKRMSEERLEQKRDENHDQNPGTHDLPPWVIREFGWRIR